MPLKTATKPATKRAARGASRLNLRALHREVTQFCARVEGLEDLRELNNAIACNAGKPGIPSAQAKDEGVNDVAALENLHFLTSMKVFISHSLKDGAAASNEGDGGICERI